MKRQLFLLLLLVFFLQSTFSQAQTRRFVKSLPGCVEYYCDIDWKIAHYYERIGDDYSLYASCWNTASYDLQFIIDISYPGDEIWVAGGVYTPRIRADLVPDGVIYFCKYTLFERFHHYCLYASLYDRAAAFVLKPGVRIYGGFFGDEGCLSERDLRHRCKPSILSGLLPNGEHVYHVVISVDCDENTVLDGFTITGGRATKNYHYQFDFITVKGQQVFHHSGGGIYNVNSSMIFSNLLVEDNQAFLNGGGIYESDGSSSFIANSVIRNNSAGFGGGIYFLYDFHTQEPSRTVLNTVLINNNTAVYRGGGVYVAASEPVIVNTTILNNSVTGISGGGGIYVAHDRCMLDLGLTSTLRLFNTIVWGNTAPHQGNFIQDKRNIFRSQYTNIKYSHCLIEGSGGSWLWNWEFGYDLGNNTDTNPLLTGYSWECQNPDQSWSPRKSYSPASNSPLIDMGLDDYYWIEGRGYLILQLGFEHDLNFHPRFNGTIDIGAYEVP